jgi:hypothetical protein
VRKRNLLSAQKSWESVIESRLRCCRAFALMHFSIRDSLGPGTVEFSVNNQHQSSYNSRSSLILHSHSSFVDGKPLLSDCEILVCLIEHGQSKNSPRQLANVPKRQARSPWLLHIYTLLMDARAECRIWQMHFRRLQ